MKFFQSLSQKLTIKMGIYLCGGYIFMTKHFLHCTQVSTAFKADPDLTAAVLRHAILKQPAPGIDAIRDILLSDSLIDTVNRILNGNELA